MLEMTDAEFDLLVEDALAQVPEEFQQAFDNLVIFVADEAPHGEDMLGVFEGHSLLESAQFDLVEPNRITIFKKNILDACVTTEEVRHEVLITVMHEIAHYFGVDEVKLHELGWG